MAFKNFTSELKSQDRDLVIFRLMIPTNGSSALATSWVGQGYIPARTGVGTMTLTPVQGLSVSDRPMVTASLGLAAVAAKFAQVGTINTTTGVITINCVDGSGAASEWPTANANAVLNVLIVLRNSSQLPVRSTSTTTL